MNVEPDTTNISDLPIIPSQPVSNDETIQNMNLSTDSVGQDPRTIIEKELQQKRVRFQEDHGHQEDSSTTEIETPSYKWILTLEHKIVLLAVFFFFVFMDPKFKKYLLNILVQIFGVFLKNEAGNMSKIGMFVYSLFYGFILLACVSLIDLTSFHLAF